MTELKPCPFCGEEADKKNNGYWNDVYDPDTFAVIDNIIGDPDMFWIECPECGAMAIRLGWVR